MDDAKVTKKQMKMPAAHKSAMKSGYFKIQSKADLTAAIKKFPNAKDQAGLKAHIITRAKALGYTSELPPDWASVPGRDVAMSDLDWDRAWITCPDCPGRKFLGEKAFVDHADTVHTFSDLQCMVGDELREQFGRQGNYNVTPSIPGIYVWVQDMTDSWVVYEIDGGDDDGLYKATYSIDGDNNVTFGDPVEVVRRTVYDPVKDND